MYAESKAASYCLFFSESFSLALETIYSANFLTEDRFSWAFPILARRWSSFREPLKTLKKQHIPIEYP